MGIVIEDLELRLRFGIVNWGLDRLLGFGIGDWDWDSDLGLVDWVWGLGLGIGIVFH